MRKIGQARAKYVFIVLTILLLSASLALPGLAPTPARAQGCDVTVNVAVGSGPTCVTFDTSVTYSSATNPGDPAVFGKTVYLQFLTPPQTCVDIVVESQSGWTTGPYPQLNYLSWDCMGGAVGVYGSDDPSFHGGYIAARHEFMWASPTSFTITLHLHNPATPTPTPTPSLTPTPTFAPTSTPALTPNGTCTSSWTLKYDFATVGNHNDQGWTALPNSTIGGFIDNDGYHPSVKTIPTDGSKYAFYLSISRQLQADTVLTALSMDVDYIPGQPFTDDMRQIKAMVGDGTLINAGSPPPAGRNTYNWTGHHVGGVIRIDLYATGAQVGQAIIFQGDVLLKSITLSGIGRTPEGTCVPNSNGQSGNTDSGNSWAYPVAMADQTGLKQISLGQTTAGPDIFRYLIDGVPSSPAYDTAKTATLFFAKNVSVNVHSATDGTVTEVVPIERDGLCTALTSGFKLPTFTCPYDFFLTQYAWSYQSVYRVTVAVSGSDTLSYLVTSPTVTVGQTVSKSCILGKAISFYVLQLNPTLIASEYQLNTAAYTIVQGRSSDTPFDLTPRFAEEPRDIQCGLPTANGCTLVRNPTFSSSADQWTSTDLSVTPHNPPGESTGILLTSGVRQSLNLDPSMQYVINVRARQITPAGDVRVDFSLKLGTTEEIVQVAGTTSDTVTIDAATYTANLSGLFDLVIAPTANTRSNVIIDFVCVSDTDELPVAPSECLLRNFEFDSSQYWTVDSGIVQFNGGMAWLTDPSVITQEVTLHPKDTGPQQYKISMIARRYGAPSTGESITLTWSLTGGSGGIGDSLAGLTNQNFKTKEDLFTVDTTTMYTLNLESEGTGGSGQTLQIDRICIQTADGTSPPGYKNLPPIPFTVECKVCAYSPVGDVNVDLPEVIAWLLCAITQIWHCQAKTILMGIWQAIVDVLTFLGFWRLWMFYTVQTTAAWGNDNVVVALRYMNGLVLNLQTAIVDAIYSGPRGVIVTDTGTSFWDALVSLFNGIRDITTSIVGLISNLVDRVFWLILLLVAIIISVINLIIQFVLAASGSIIGFITVLFTTIQTALSAPPSAVTGIPICDMNADMIPESCVGIFVLEQSFFFDGSPLNFIMPLVQGTTVFALFWWAIHQFKGALEK